MLHWLYAAIAVNSIVGAPSLGQAGDTPKTAVSLAGAPETLVISAREGKAASAQKGIFEATAETYLYLKNDGANPLRHVCVSAKAQGYDYAEASVLLSFDDGKPDDRICEDLSPGIGPAGVRQLHLKIQAVAGKLPYSGFLLFSASPEELEGHACQAQGSDPSECLSKPGTAVKNFVIETAWSGNNVLRVVGYTWSGAAVFFIITACFVFYLSGKILPIKTLSRRIGPTKWSATASPATNLAGVTTLVAALISSTTLAAHPHYMTKSSYVGLGAYLGFVVLLSAGVGSQIGRAHV